ncbi:MAG: lytic transglycosylase domain-containing protein [Bdellovibrionales bacterium]|nr:lytic transglycosylase domain-containing protein [Bdellovibrionales bacterium]
MIPNKKNKTRGHAILFVFFVFFGSTPLTIAQEGRFQKLGVKLDAWAESQVLFWKKIYIEYNTFDHVIHDSMNLRHVYAVTQDPESVKREERAVRARLLRLSEMQKGSIEKEKLDPGLIRIYEAMDAVDDPRVYSFAANPERIRVQTGLKDRLETAFLTSKKYLGRMREIFAEEGVPEELVLLPFVESAFNSEARSKVGATGIWQFMPKTAIKDLRVTASIDERHDPLKSTRAAARFLRKNHELLQNWGLAIMAYHHGAGMVQKAIRKVGTRDPVTIIRTFKDPSFRFASRNYLFEFLAMCDVADRRGPLFRPAPDQGLPQFITVSFQNKTWAKDILQRYRLNEEEIRILNPHFREPIWSSENPIPAHYPVRLAGITLEEFRRLEYPER